MEGAEEPSPRRSMPRKKTCIHCKVHVASLKRHFGQAPVCRDKERRRAAKEETEASAQEGTTSGAQALFKDVIKTMVADNLAALEYDKAAPPHIIDGVVVAVKRWLDMCKAELRAMVTDASLPKATIGKMHTIIDETLDIFKGLESRHLRKTFLKETEPYIEPDEIDYGSITIKTKDTNGFTYGSRAIKQTSVHLPISETLIRRLQHCRRTRDLCIESSDKWKTGDLFQQSELGGCLNRRGCAGIARGLPQVTSPDTCHCALYLCAVPDTIADITDARVCRFHERLFKKATPAEQNQLRLAIGIYDDGIEVRYSLAAALAAGLAAAPRPPPSPPPSPRAICPARVCVETRKFMVSSQRVADGLPCKTAVQQASSVKKRKEELARAWHW